ncbi:NADH-quinone oxidoreductase subunit NuoF [Xianfuyuplasma coldseepsis]|uniref:NADH-quinone oxidoreductase subunit NuoF n=1 Tax=Candidatus Xianfuyuplasma coldseepsis TaxID=2782163 RepID=A0A7L7KUP2_9MOLU|nr:NADH-quinone oxidoreductase subunit NuoF [Xianfuyuplasma coldseepsis]
MLVCGGKDCPTGNLVVSSLKDKIEKLELYQQVHIITTGCVRPIEQGTIIKIQPDNVLYENVTVQDVDEIVKEHIQKGRVVNRLLSKNALNDTIFEQEVDFYKKQLRIALRNCGFIDPHDIKQYISARGYEALAHCLTELQPKEIVEIIKESQLRGRGGGGFPTGLKWELTARENSEEKYIICNADEGDPGAFMDRSILEGDPHSIIEAMAIAGYAIGSNTGIVYIRAEYPLAINRLEVAIEQAREYGFLGDHIFDSNFSFDIELRLGAGAFVCGEETALINSLEGGRGEPTKKPPFPSVSGFRKKPTSVNNVETFANIPPIILNGAEWFASIGTEKSKGTKVFALAGKVNNVGLVEVPMGTTLREIIYDIGGGIVNNKEFKALQTGGPSGGVITAKDLDTPIDYESLKAIGSMMGSGGMIVLDEEDDMVQLAKFYLDFTQDESCGKCTPCRIGTKRMYEILDRLTKMEGSPEDLDILEDLAQNIKYSSLCGLGQTAPNPVLSTMEYFRKEYDSYAYRTKKVFYSIDEEKCIGCTKCVRVCPVACISGSVKQPHSIDEDVCIACGACYDACRFDAIIRP